MTKEKIIEDITNDEFYLSYCKSICKGADVHQDLYQYIMLSLIEMDEKKLLAIQKGNIKGYICRMIWLNATSKTSPFICAKDKTDSNINTSLFDGDSLTTYQALENYNNFCTREYQDCKLAIEYEKTHEENFKKVQDFITKEIKSYEKKGRKAYNVELLKLHASGKSLRRIAEETGIPYPSIRYTIKCLTDRINEDIANNATEANRS